MSSELWLIKVDVQTEFFLSEIERFSADRPLDPSVERLVIIPKQGEKGEQTGIVQISIGFRVDVTGEERDALAIADLGRDILNSYLALLTFMSGRPISLVSKPYLVHLYPGTRKGCTITFPPPIWYPGSVAGLICNAKYSARFEKKPDTAMVI